MTQGEFKKRIKDLAALDRLFLISEEAMRELVDEAKKDWPMAKYGDNLLEVKDCRRLLKERHEWFDRWFCGRQPKK